MAACVPQLARAFLGKASILSLFYNINIIIEFVLLSIFFYNFNFSKKRKALFNIFFVIGIVGGSLLFFKNDFVYRFQNDIVCLNNLIYTAWILTMILEIYENDQILFDYKSSLFWLIIGLFFYTSCTVLIFSLWHYIKSMKSTRLDNLWIIHDFFNVIMYICFSIAFLKSDVKNNKSQYFIQKL